MLADLASGRADGAWLHRLVDYVEAGIDLADHRVLIVLKLLLVDRAQPTLPDAWREPLEHAVLGFRYWLDEPGEDSMCRWSESHQLLFSVSEHLAGQLFGERRFGSDGRLGSVKRQRGRERLMAWLGDRFRHGFSEWLSNTYYELDIVGLTLLVEHSDDQELADRAALVLDLLLLDLALHRFEGRFVASAGRAYRAQKMSPKRAEINGILGAAFGTPPRFDPEHLASLFLDRERYRVPAVITEIAHADGARRILTSHGMNVEEAIDDVTARMAGAAADERRDELVRVLWGMEAITTTQSIGVTLEAFTRYRLQRNRFLAPLTRFARLPVRRASGTIMRALNPVTQGVALQRANVQTFRTPHYLLSSAQHHQPGAFGDQQHLWQASLPGDIAVFSTHPGATMLSGEARPATPSAWVGNGINPDVAQVDNVLLVVHDLRARPGYLEGRRHELSHLFFPFSRFDETTLGPSFVAGRKGDSFIAVMGIEPLEMVSEHELVQRGPITAWAVVVTDRGEYARLDDLVRAMRGFRLRYQRGVLSFQASMARQPGEQRTSHAWELAFGKGLRVDGVPINGRYARYDCDWVTMPHGATQLEVHGRTSTLVLDWARGIRAEVPLRGSSGE